MEEPFALFEPEAGHANEALPVVVLMGWVGAQRDGAILKYAHFLAQHGYATVRSVQPADVAFSPWERPRRRWAQALLAFLRARGLWPQRRLVLYAFSNGGAFVVEQLMLLAESNAGYSNLPSSLAGVIFDSAPAYMHPGTLAKVIQETQPPGLGRTLRTAWYAAASRVVGAARPATFWANMARLDWGAPQLFLYSTDDHLCDGAKVDELVAAKSAAGQRVRSRRWQRSEHCGHFRRHREEYATEMLGFLAGLQPREGQAEARHEVSGNAARQGARARPAARPPAVVPRARL